MSQFLRNTFGALALSALSSGAATATVIDFDDLENLTQIESYHGLQWSNFSVLQTSIFSHSGYANSVVSEPNVAYNREGNPASFFTADSTTFTLRSLYLTSAWSTGLMVTIQGLANGLLTNTITLTVGTLAPTNFVLDWADIDRVNFASEGGIDIEGFTEPRTQFAIDNVVIGTDTIAPIPLPAALPLLVGAIGSLVLLRRRRRVA